MTTRPCPHCAAAMPVTLSQCPACGKRVAPLRRSRARTAWAVAIIAAGVLGGAAMADYFTSRARVSAPRTASPTAQDAERERALKALRAANPRARLIQWAGPSNLWAYYADDGSPRDGLARSYCEELRQLGVRDASVRIQDAGAVGSGSPRTLGRATC